MGYRLLADLLVVLHALFVLFVVFGSFLAFWRRSFLWVQVPAALWGAAVELFGWICPLTPLEQEYRTRAGQAGYAGGFIDHYLASAIYPAGLTATLQFVLGVLVLFLNGACYWVLRRRTRLTRARSHG